MRILIAEDDFASRKFMLKFLSKFGECDITVDGMEAVDAYLMALDADTPYDLVCLDIMMPALDGYQALKAIRDIEQERKIPEDQRAFAIFPLGYPAEERAQQDRFDESRIHFDA